MSKEPQHSYNTSYTDDHLKEHHMKGFEDMGTVWWQTGKYNILPPCRLNHRQGQVGLLPVKDEEEWAVFRGILENVPKLLLAWELM